MINVVLFEPEIPQNTGNIMRTCAGTYTKLHLIKPLGFSLSDKYLKRSGVNYIDKLEYFVYENWEEFKSKNPGKYFYFTRYGKRPHTEFDFKPVGDEEIYLVFGKESTGIPKEILKDELEKCMIIPMTSNVRALNVSNSVAVAIYEALRHQDYNDLLREEPEDEGHKGADYLERE